MSFDEYSMRQLPPSFSKPRFVPLNKDIETMTAFPLMQALYLNERLKKTNEYKSEYQQAVAKAKANYSTSSESETSTPRLNMTPKRTEELNLDADILDIQNESIGRNLGQPAFTRVSEIKQPATMEEYFKQAELKKLLSKQKYTPKALPAEIFNLPTYINIINK